MIKIGLWLFKVNLLELYFQNYKKSPIVLCSLILVKLILVNESIMNIVVVLYRNDLTIVYGSNQWHELFFIESINRLKFIQLS